MAVIGSRIGVFEIVAKLGEGGMGVVYRATDTALGRPVAIKLLPENVANDPGRLARFDREARTLASLNHANIAQIYGLEKSPDGYAFAMELVEGPTLAEVIARGAMPLDEALRTARQIADALETAHDQGIIHRDLKPANIKVRSDGTVKVLDFGLATAVQHAGDSRHDAANSPTLTVVATQVGIILGTAAYMSPEQAAGRQVDKRADIWSFGVVLWEMLTGRRLFDGESVSHTLADVLRANIDFGALPDETPASVRALLRRCLDRDVKARLRDIGEARVVLQACLTDSRGERATTTIGAPQMRRSVLTISALGVAALAMVAAVALAVVHFGERPEVQSPIRFQILPPEQITISNGPVMSPDGRKIVFDGPGPDGRASLWVRSLDTLETRLVPGTEGVAPGPFWSPDSRFIAFAVNGYPGRLKKVRAGSGPPQTICEYSSGYREGAWNTDGTIVFATVTHGLMRVSSDGGTPTGVTSVDPSRQEVQHAGPAFLPDGRHFLYHRASRSAEHSGIYLGSIDATPEAQSTTRLLISSSDPVFVPSPNRDRGVVLFLREGALMAQAINPGWQSMAGDAVPIANDVGTTGSYGWFSASHTGALVFRSGPGAVPTLELRWADREGNLVGQIATEADYGRNGVQLSPDGKRLAVTRGDPTAFSGALGAIQGAHIWTAELSRPIFSRLISSENSEGSPAWSPDGRVAFTSTMAGAIGDLYWVTVGGVGAPEPLLVKSPTVKHPNDFSPDGRFLIFDDHHPTQRQDLYILPVAPGAGTERTPIPFLVTQADETFGQFSPDGKWIAYSSDESGRREVYVQGFDPNRVPAAAVGKWTVSTAGGDKPRWGPGGKELYYLAPDRKLMAVPVKPGTTLDFGIAVPLFSTRLLGFFAYDVGADGRFLLPMPSRADIATMSPMTVVLNWQAQLTP